MRYLLALALFTAPCARAQDAENVESLLTAYIPEETQRANSLEAIVGAVPEKNRPEAIARLKAFTANATVAELKKAQRAFILFSDAEGLRLASEILARASPEDPEATVGLAHSKVLAGDYDSAHEAATLALKANPDDQRARDLVLFTARKSRRSGSLSPSAPSSSAVASGSGLSAEKSAAGRRATGRLEAIRYAKQAMTRLDVGDADETLRLATLAEKADPTLADSYMQQGLAWRDKGDFKRAAERFELAGALWRLSGTERGRKNAATLADRALAQVRRDEESVPEAPKGQKSSMASGAAAAGASAVAGTLIVLGGIRRRLYSDGAPAWEKHAKVGALSVAIGFGVVYGGAWLATAAGPTTVRWTQGLAGAGQRALASQQGAIFPKGDPAQNLIQLQKLPWTSWAQYPKLLVNGREYAKIGERLYTRHAVDHMMPRAMNVGAGVEGRSMSPTFVEDVIQRGTRSVEVIDGLERIVHRLGTAKVVTEQGEQIVVTVNPNIKP